ncbi:MAG: PorV/PorQ family protein [Candidatus Eisenbacteria bacterium]|nr:PorV/PorQ family protein [Candidatus Eisenbacteria bacterium]
MQRLRIGVLLLIGLLSAGLGSGAGAATGLAFLKNGVDARASLLGQAMSSVVGDASACYWNPAGLARRDTPQLLLSHTEGFADLRQEYLAALQPAGPFTFGLFFNGLWTDNLEGFDRAGNATGSFGVSSFAAGVSAGREVYGGLLLGATGKYLREDIGVYSATGYAFDAGLQWRCRRMEGLQFGLTVQNVGSDMKFLVEEFSLPLAVQGGVSWRRPTGAGGRLLVAADLRHVQDEGTGLLVGVEYGYREMLSLGVGYQGGHELRDVGFGIGAHPGRVDLHWAYMPMAEEMGDEHRVSLRVDL